MLIQLRYLASRTSNNSSPLRSNPNLRNLQDYLCISHVIGIKTARTAALHLSSSSKNGLSKSGYSITETVIHIFSTNQMILPSVLSIHVLLFAVLSDWNPAILAKFLVNLRWKDTILRKQHNSFRYRVVEHYYMFIVFCHSHRWIFHQPSAFHSTYGCMNEHFFNPISLNTFLNMLHVPFWLVSPYRHLQHKIWHTLYPSINYWSFFKILHLNFSIRKNQFETKLSQSCI